MQIYGKNKQKARASQVKKKADGGLGPCLHHFSRALLDWYDRERRDLPWRGSADPYKIWVSEIILQQTRVEQGKGYYMRFLLRFPDVQSLARASQQDVLSIWQGLGYYSRAINMHKTAQIITWDRDGRFPENVDEWRLLPGVGAYTAAAVGSIAFGDPRAAVDGNVLRVMARLTCESVCISNPEARKRLTAGVQLLLCKKRPGDFNQAMMELGALVCVPGRPKCRLCPVSIHCRSYGLNQTQFYPVMAPKSPPKLVTMWYLVYFNQNGIYLHQRGNGSIWRQMWEFVPVSETQYRDMLKVVRNVVDVGNVYATADVDIENAGKTGISVIGKEPENLKFRVISELEGAVEHRLTHRLLLIYLLPVDCGVGYTDDSLNFVAWIDLKNFPTPVVFSRYLKEMNFYDFSNKLTQNNGGA
jgi:A/G-specific adenine glycosylase